MVILENVLGLVRLNSSAFVRVIELLRSFGYKTQARVLNTMHFGVAQSRKRVYVVAIRRDSLIPRLKWPQPWALRAHETADKVLPQGEREPVPQTKAAKRNLKMAKKKFKQPSDEVVVDIGASEGYAEARLGHSPCITRRRAKNYEYWLLKRHRRINARDLCILQGMDLIQTKDIPKTAVGAAIGNAMSHNVLESLLPCCLRAAGLIE